MQRYSTLLTLAFLFYTLAGTAQVQIEPNAMSINAPTRTPGVALEILGLSDDDGGVIQLGNSDLTQFLSIFPGRLNDPDPLFLWKDNGALRFATNANGYREIMRLTPGGQVGINTPTPAAALDVIGQARVEGRLELLAAPGDSSIFIGAGAGVNDDGTDNRNTGIGNGALHFNTAGFANTATGYKALFSNIDGDFNVANGYQALHSNIDGNFNVANGILALYSNTTGENNVANGRQALRLNIDGDFNVASGAFAMENNTSGVGNTGSGTGALFSNTTGNYNTAVGFDASNLPTNFENSSAFGYSAQPGGSNFIRLGNNSVTNIEGQVNFQATSDGRFKKMINDNVPGVAFIMELRPVTYHFDWDAMDDWRAKAVGRRDSSGLLSRKKIEQVQFSGFIAQEVEAAAEKIGYDFSGVVSPKTDQQSYALRYAEFTVPLVQATQEQQEMIEDLKSEIRDQKLVNERLQNELDELRNMLEKVAGNQQAGNEPIILDQAPSLEQNEPNPFTGATRINYFLPDEALAKSGRAELLITSVDGKELQRVTLAQAGRSYINLQTRTYPTGTYQYSLVVDGQVVATKRMVLQR